MFWVMRKRSTSKARSAVRSFSGAKVIICFNYRATSWRNNSSRQNKWFKIFKPKRMRRAGALIVDLGKSIINNSTKVTISSLICRSELLVDVSPFSTSVTAFYILVWQFRGQPQPKWCHPHISKSTHQMGWGYLSLIGTARAPVSYPGKHQMKLHPNFVLICITRGKMYHIWAESGAFSRAWYKLIQNLQIT
jgi:hypothetical protein